MEIRIALRTFDGEELSERIRLLHIQGRVKGRCKRRQALRRAHEARVACLDGHRGSRDFLQARVLKLDNDAEVGTDANAFDQGGRSDEARGRSDVEVPVALGDSGGVKAGQGGDEGLDVSLLLGGDGREVSVEVCGVAGCGEICCGEVGEALAVEGVLEVFEVEGELEEGDVGRAWWVGVID